MTAPADDALPQANRHPDRYPVADLDIAHGPWLAPSKPPCSGDDAIDDIFRK
jgi:hypothetical protein